MQINDLLAAATRELSQAGIEEAALDARLLWQHLTAMGRSQLVLHGAAPVDEPTAASYRRLIEQRCQRIPLQHLTGSQEFWSMEFMVSPAVLIPRPETEFLLEQALNVCAAQQVTTALDLCTGSGVIAVVLAKELGCAVVAIDISPDALAVAANNFATHGVTGQVMPLCGDLFAPLRATSRFDLLVSNPPYIAEEEIDRLEPEVSRAEPRLALAAGPDGLDCIRRIAAGAHRFLRPGGWLLSEIGADQKRAVLALFASSGLPYGEVRVLDDWAGRPRVVQARYLPE